MSTESVIQVTRPSHGCRIGEQKIAFSGDRMQAPGFSTWVLLLGLTCGLLVASANLIFYLWILPEVNASLAEGQKISPFFVSVKLFEIVRIHTRLGPKSKTRTLMFVLFGLGVFCAFSGLLFGVVH
jgi:hypothetical protein